MVQFHLFPQKNLFIKFLIYSFAVFFTFGMEFTKVSNTEFESVFNFKMSLYLQHIPYYRPNNVRSKRLC